MDARHWNGGPDDDSTCTEDFDTCECPFCREWRDNRVAGDDADGEDFRGGEAAAYEREQQAEIQRNLK